MPASINFGHLRWKAGLEGKIAALIVADGLAMTGSAQSTANTGAAGAVAAQGTADDALELATVAENKADSANSATAAIAAAGGQVAAPVIQAVGGNSYILTCATSGASITYRKNLGSWTAYAGSFTLLAGDSLEAYATKAGLTDSEALVYERN